MKKLPAAVPHPQRTHLLELQLQQLPSAHHLHRKHFPDSAQRGEVPEEHPLPWAQQHRAITRHLPARRAHEHVSGKQRAIGRAGGVDGRDEDACDGGQGRVQGRAGQE